MTVLLPIGLASGVITLLGGALALRFRARLDLLTGLGGGALLGVALFDLMAEAMSLGGPGPLDLLSLAGLGFAAALAFDHLTVGRRGGLAAAALTVHSLIDGLAIGLAFQASAAVGLVVAVAVLTHDLLDGANTVAFTLSDPRGRRSVIVWLAADAAAPLCGLGLSRLLAVSRQDLALMLALFCGLFLYLGTAELTRPYPSGARPWPRLLAGLAGLALIDVIVRLAA